MLDSYSQWEQSESGGRDSFCASLWTEANSSCQSHSDAGTLRSQEAELSSGHAHREAVEGTVATNGIHEPVFALDMENGYGSPPDRAAARETRLGAQRHSPRPADLLDTEDKDCSKLGNSHVPKVVPLKPQRSKKSLNKENKGVSSPQTQTGEDGPWEAGSRAEDPGRQAEKQQLRDAAAFQENIVSSSKVPTAPPRSLPLKTQWSRDRPSSLDSSLAHYRTSGQEPAKRKQAVKPSASSQPVCASLERQTLHELQAMWCQPCFEPSKLNQSSNQTESHPPPLIWLCVRKQKFTFLSIASLAQRAVCFPLFPLQRLTSAWPFQSNSGL